MNHHSNSINFLSGTPMVIAIFCKVQIWGFTRPFSIFDRVPRENPASKYMRSCEYPLVRRTLAMCAPNLFKNACCFGSISSHRVTMSNSYSSNKKGIVKKVKFRKEMPKNEIVPCFDISAPKIQPAPSGVP